MPWIVSYLSTWLGLVLALAVTIPVMAMVSPLFILADTLGDNRGTLGLVFFLNFFGGIVWIWFGLRFSFPVVFRVAIEGWKGILGISYLVPAEVVKIIKDGLRALKNDLLFVFRFQNRTLKVAND